MAKLSITVIYDDVTITAKLDKQRAVLNIADIVMAGAVSVPSLISDDTGNALKLGNDNKLAIKTDELKTTFDYAATVKAVWSI